MAYRNKTYVCFDADNDMLYYRLMTAWKENEKIEFNFHNAHDLNNLKVGSSEATIKAKLRERLQNTKVLVVLIGENTKNLYKYVRWEIEWAIENNIPIVALNLNGKRQQDDLCPPILKSELAMFINFGQKIINFALNNWTIQHYNEKVNGKSGPFYYPDKIYNEL
jgi:MTH538 TIR-like domain (DUF1863)